MYNKQLNNDLPAFVIISAELVSRSTMQNIIRTEQLKEQLKSLGFRFKQVEGKYIGIREDSFVVLLDNILLTDPLKTLRDLANQYGQESILYVSSERAATLLFIDDTKSPVYVGQFKVVDEHVAHRLNGCTYDRDSGYYYAAY